jgi:hypothetical protein
MAQVTLLALATLPMLCLVGSFAGLNLLTLAALAAVSVAPLFALAGVSLLASVWSRQTRDAVLAVYLCGAIGFLLLWVTGYLLYFDPLYVLAPTWGDNPDWKELGRRLTHSVLVWGGLGVVFVGLAVWRLRPAYLRQLQGEGRRKKVRWWRAQRSAIPDEPIRWKERQVEGIAPFAVLREVPRWFGLVLVAVATVISSLLILWSQLQANLSFSGFVRELLQLHILEMDSLIAPAGDPFYWQGLAAMILATLLVGVRCSGAITGERERQTWEALMLSSMPVKRLLRGKLWGILGASVPYVLAYGAPAFLLSLLGGGMAVIWTVLWFAVTWLAMAFVGSAGLWSSARCKSSWGSLLFTLLIGYAGGFLLFVVAFPVAWVLFMFVFIVLILIDLLSGSTMALGQTFLALSSYVGIGVCVALVLLFLVMTRVFLRAALNYVKLHERTWHWSRDREERWHEEFDEEYRRNRKHRPEDPEEEIPEVLKVDVEE